VTVVTGAPNHPTGVLYEGYRNRFVQRERIDGIDVIRVYVYLAPNKGFFKRILNYLSFMATSSVVASCSTGRCDVVLATSPQFFTAVSGYIVSKMKGRPFIFEVRDLWPKSIVALGALKNPWLIRWLEKVELFLYRHATHIVGTVDGIKADLVKRGIEEEKISLIPNGVDLELFRPYNKGGILRHRYGLMDWFIVSYIGTHGLAHALDKVLLAAETLKQERIAFVFIGEGAEKGRLVRMKQERGLNNVFFMERQPRERIPLLIADSDVCLVSLRKDKFFFYALPSKMLEIMACGRPVILSANGESRALLEKADAGVWVGAEDPGLLADGILKLYGNPDFCKRLGDNGRRFVQTHFDRQTFAFAYEEVLEHEVKRPVC